MEDSDLIKLSPEQLRQLARQIKAIQARQGAAPTAQIEGGVKVDKGDAVVGTKIGTINIRYGIYEGEAPRSPAEARSIYLSVIADRCGDIPLTGLDREADDAESRYRPLGLERVYIDLDTQLSVSAKAVEKALATRQAQAMPLFGEDRADDRRPLSALEATALQRRLVLTGAPGSGKTTFVNRLCLALARAEWKDLERWPKRERQRLPVLVILRDLAQWIASRLTLPEPCAELLWEFIEHDLRRRKLDFAGKLVEQALEQGQTQVFLDGLDEVPLSLRPTLLPTLDEFARRYENAWLLITCRVASYQQAEWRLPEERFPKFELAPFDSDKIQHFVTAWYDEMAERWKEPRERTHELAAKLNEAVRRSDLARLAPNPLAESGAFWREVILLAVGYLVHSVGEYEQPLVLVDRLCPSKQPVNAAGWRKVGLAGEVLLEIGLNRVERQEQGESLLERVRKRLTALVERGLLDPAERAQAGEVLGTLGDPRFDAKRLYLSCRYRDKEEVNWGFVEIPKGYFLDGQ